MSVLQFFTVHNLILRLPALQMQIICGGAHCSPCELSELTIGLCCKGLFSYTMPILNNS